MKNLFFVLSFAWGLFAQAGAVESNRNDRECYDLKPIEFEESKFFPVFALPVLPDQLCFEAGAYWHRIWTFRFEGQNLAFFVTPRKVAFEKAPKGEGFVQQFPVTEILAYDHKRFHPKNLFLTIDGAPVEDELGQESGVLSLGPGLSFFYWFADDPSKLSPKHCEWLLD